MQAQVYEGYFKDGRFYSNEKQLVKIPEQYKVFITLFNEPIMSDVLSEQPIKKPFFELFGKWSGKIKMSDDFDAPLDEMKEYMK